MGTLFYHFINVNSYQTISYLPPFPVLYMQSYPNHGGCCHIAKGDRGGRRGLKCRVAFNVQIPSPS